MDYSAVSLFLSDSMSSTGLIIACSVDACSRQIAWKCLFWCVLLGMLKTAVRFDFGYLRPLCFQPSSRKCIPASVRNVSAALLMAKRAVRGVRGHYRHSGKRPWLVFNVMKCEYFVKSVIYITFYPYFGHRWLTYFGMLPLDSIMLSLIITQ